MADYSWFNKRRQRSIDQLRPWSNNPRLNPEERYRLRLCEADMKLDVGLPQQSNYYGERCRF
jgi:hypothetical protein